MLPYNEYEQKIYDWFMQKHESDNSFTFSLRKKANKGSERKYFIGSERSSYFGTTLFTVPVGFPGSSTDLNDIIFILSEDSLRYYIEFTQTRAPKGDQNKSALKLIQSIKEQIRSEIGIGYESKSGNKMETYRTKTISEDYSTIEDLLIDLDKDFSKIVPIIEQGIVNEKKNNPSFVAHRITKDEFESMQKSLKRRLEKYPDTGGDNGNEPLPETPIIDNIPKKTQSNSPLNQILFGPPGTGKTYHSINKAIEIIDPNFDLTQEREVIKQEFDKYVEKGQIVFTTFHQSMSYEDFIEGIKPMLVSKEGESESTIKYDIQDGIFKEIVERSKSSEFKKAVKGSLHIPKSKFKEPINKVSLGNYSNPEDAGIYEYCIENNCVAMGFGEDIDFTGVKNRKDIRDKYKEAGINIESNMDFQVSAIERLVLWMKPGQLVFVSHGNSRLKAIGEVDGDYYCDTSTKIKYSQFRKVKWLYQDLNLSMVDVYGKKFSQQTIYQLDGNNVNKDFFSDKETDKDDSPNNHVLIIDEINRGNVSQIFGELITLIEEDKRIGESEELRVTLPYSKDSDDKFGVPSNLYIIGTMNTADRSVEALDTALRRRFSFVEMPPEPDVVSKHGSLKNQEGILRSGDFNIDLVELLQTINDRIEILLDRDHLIGHSYFMSVKDIDSLSTSFAKQIIPLLQEYFYGDYGKISLVLGEGFCEGVRADTKNVKFATTKDYDTSVFEDKVLYKIKDVLDEGFDMVGAIKTLLNKDKPEVEKET